MSDIGHIFADTRSDQPVLKPPVGSFNFASGLRGKGVGHFHLAVLQNLFPLRGRLIGQKVVLIPEGIPSPDKAEDGVGIDVISIREAVSKEHRL